MGRRSPSDWRVPLGLCAEGDQVRCFHNYLGTRSSGFFPDSVTPPGFSTFGLEHWARGPEFVAGRIVELRLGERFPEVELDYRGPDVVEHYRLRHGVWGTRSPEGDLVAQEAALSELVAWAEHRSIRVRHGWSGAPVVAPTRVVAPMRDGAPEARGGYRTSAREAQWTWTEPTSTQERLLRWVLLRNRGAWPFAAEAAVHDDTLFVKDRVDDAHAWALPVGSVRARWELGAGDMIYVFGRHTHVGFFGRGKTCPVRAILERHFDEGR